MDEPRSKYILTNDRVGEIVEKSMLGLTSKTSPTQVLRGELLEALPEDEQPQDSHRIAVVGLDRKNLRLVCPTEDLTRLSDEDADLLLPISSVGERYNIFIDRKRLVIGRKINHGSRVLVKVKGMTKDLVGVVWYKGEVQPLPGTTFGVELIENMGEGTSDGTFRNKRYFECPKDSGVFVGLDKITLEKDWDTRSLGSPKKEESSHFNVAARLKEAMLQPFSKGRNERKLSHDAMKRALKIDQRAMAHINGKAVRGRVRYIGEERDPSGQPYMVVGLELDSLDGAGTGILHGKQRFVCRRGFSCFVPIEMVKPEEDFEGISQEWKNAQEQLPVPEKHSRDEVMGRSLSYSVNTAANRGHGARKRSNSFDSAEVIKAAGESSNTDTIEFIEKQRQLLMECESAKSRCSAREDYRRGEERADSATEMNFKENHFQPIAALSKLHTVRDDTQERPITEQPGHSSIFPRNHERKEENMYTDFVNIDKQDYEERMDSPKRSKQGDDPVISRGSSQPLSSCSNELTSSELGMERNKSLVLMADVVTDCVASASEQLDPPYEHMDIQEAEEATDIDKTGATNNERPADVPQSMEVGSMVEVPMAEGVPRYGVIRWIGRLPQVKDKLVAGLELEEEQTACSDGTFNGQRYFSCPSGRGFFTLLQHCRQDSRFTGYSPTKEKSLDSEKAFGSFMSPVVPGVTAPPSSLQDKYCGTMRGLQGHHNSCYLDATLYSMFAFSSVFDTLLHRQKRPDDLDDYEEVQVVLKEHIVNPLRINGFVRADRLLNLRTLLDKLGSTSGLVNEEKDPEEFLNSLLHQVLKADPFLQLKPRDVHAVNNEGAYFYQIITEKDETAKMVEVHQLLEQSFLSADLILSEVPSCLILQMPRFGSKYKMYDMILPNLELDVTHIVENVLRECGLCGKEVAQFECKECYKDKVVGDRKGLSSFCSGCNSTLHSHRDRSNHEPRPIKVPRAFDPLKDKPVESQKMELFAVVCIETSHYVAFVKCGTGPQAPWCFFDSMADRKGEKNGYNIPAVAPCPEALEWLSKRPNEILAARERGQIPEKARRLLGDAYLCMYQNLDMAMYK